MMSREALHIVQLALTLRLKNNSSRLSLVLSAAYGQSHLADVARNVNCSPLLPWYIS